MIRKWLPQWRRTGTVQNEPPACAIVRTWENMKQFVVRGNVTPDVQQGDTRPYVTDVVEKPYKNFAL